MSPATLSTVIPLHHKLHNSPLVNIATASTKQGIGIRVAMPEGTRPVLAPRTRLTMEDLPSIDCHRLVMALMSGMLAESTQALDTLNILLRDDRSISCCRLDTMPGLLDCLVEHWSDIRSGNVKGRKEELGGSSDSYTVMRGDSIDLSGERVVLLNESAIQGVTIVPDSYCSEGWVQHEGEDGKWPVVGHIVQPGMGRWEEEGMDCEALNLVGEVAEQGIDKLAVVTTVLRNLSSVPGNEEVMGRHTGFLSQCGEALASKDAIGCLELENVLVCLASIGHYTDLSWQPSRVVMDILSSLIYWAVSYSTMAMDAFTDNSPHSPHRLSMEILCKLCLHQSNTDLVLATPPRERLDQLGQVLAKKLYKSEDQSVRETSISLLHYIISANTEFSLSMSLHTPTISLLITFVEQAEEAAQKIAQHQGVTVLRDNPSTMGTSLATLRRAAKVLATLAQQPSTNSLFMREEQRLVNLAMSQILDQEVARSICEVMFLASKNAGGGKKVIGWGW